MSKEMEEAVTFDEKKKQSEKSTDTQCTHAGVLPELTQLLANRPTHKEAYLHSPPDGQSHTGKPQETQTQLPNADVKWSVFLF